MALGQNLKREPATIVAEEEPLYDRIGGKAAVDAAVDLMYKKLLADDSINSFFRNVDMRKQRTKMKAFLSMAFGGPAKYSGKDLQRAHESLVAEGLNEGHFNSVGGHLLETLKELEVPTELIDEVMEIVAGTKDDVLGIQNKEEHMATKNLYQDKGNNATVATENGLEKKLEQLERDYNRNVMALEQAVDAVIQIDRDKLITFYNNAAEKMFGYSKSEVIGQNVKMIVPVEHRANHDNYVQANMTTGVNKVIGTGRDLRATRKDGSSFWVNLSLSKVQSGSDIQYTAFIKDITEDRFNRERLNQSLEQAVDSVITIDNDKRIIFFNKAAEKMFQFDRNEVLGQNVKMIVPIEHRTNHDQYVDANIKTGVNRVVGTGRDLEATRRDGSKFWINLSLSKVDVDGRLQYTAFIKDITSIKNTEREQGEIIEAIKAIAVGDLTQRVKSNSNLAQEVNAALDNLNSVLGNISQGSEVVAKSSDLLQKRVEDMKRNTTEVATAIAQMAKGAQDQAARTDESSKLVNHVMTSANEMENKANMINKAAERGLESSNQGLRTVKVLVDNMNGIKDSAGQTSKSIGVLTQRTEEIGRTLNVITDIAGQTNLLALNAAIEAARAGDAGRGFAVVAEEIRKLAEDSRKSAVEIEKIIGDVQKDTVSAGKAIDTMEASVKEGNKSSSEVEKIFEEIAKSSQETFGASKEIQTATITQKDSINSVVKNIEQIVVVSEETAAGTQQVASSSQQMNGGMLEIAKAGDELSAVAAELQAGVTQFKLTTK